MPKVVWKMINGYGPYAYLQESVRSGDTVTSRHIRYLGKIKAGGHVEYEGKQVLVPVAPNLRSQSERPTQASTKVVSEDVAPKQSGSQGDTERAMIDRIVARHSRFHGGARGYDLWLTEFAAAKHGPQNAKVVDGAEFDSIDGTLLHRTVGKEEHIAANIDGSRFGEGRSGSGFYYSTSGPLKGLSESGTTYAAKLDPAAKVIDNIDFFALQAEMFADTADKYGTLDVEGGRRRMGPFYEDRGRFAAYLGYDAITGVGGSGYVLVLNNRAVIVDKRTLPDSYI